MDNITPYSHFIEDTVWHWCSLSAARSSDIYAKRMYAQGSSRGWLTAGACIYGKHISDVYNDCLRFAHSHDLLLEMDYE